MYKSFLGGRRYLSPAKDGRKVFLTRGEVPLTNNRCENAIRPFVVGRKGWLFSDTVKGAVASANLYSLVETC
ncbi:MAG: transposase, partial [Steroidobacteraceae bacterium]